MKSSIPPILYGRNISDISEKHFAPWFCHDDQYPALVLASTKIVPRIAVAVTLIICKRPLLTHSPKQVSGWMMLRSLITALWRCPLPKVGSWSWLSLNWEMNDVWVLYGRASSPPLGAPALISFSWFCFDRLPNTEELRQNPDRSRSMKSEITIN